MRNRVCFGLVCGLLFTGCALSDDPREGGIMSYFFRGEEAYERHLTSKQRIHERMDEAAHAQVSRSRELEALNEERKVMLQRNLAELEALQNELLALEQSAAASPKVSRQIQDELREHRAELGRIEVEAASSRAQARLDQLRKEIILLTDRTRILLETQ